MAQERNLQGNELLHKRRCWALGLAETWWAASLSLASQTPDPLVVLLVEIRISWGCACMSQ